MPKKTKSEQRIEVVKPVSITPKEYATHTEFSPLNEPLGALAITFSVLEDKLTMAINALLKIDYRDGLTLEDLMQSFSTRRKLFCSLVAIKTDGLLRDEVERRSGLGSHLMTCNNYRNEYLHGAWTTFYDDGSFGKVRYRADIGGLRIIESTIKVTVNDVWKAHAAIFRCALELETWRFVFNHRDNPKIWPPSWREKLK
jgi:hypothetical protein